MLIMTCLSAFTDIRLNSVYYITLIRDAICTAPGLSSLGGST